MWKSLFILSLAGGLNTALTPVVAAVISLASDVDPSGSSNPSEFTVFGGQLYFRAQTAATGSEVFRFDGSASQLVADLNPGASGSNPAALTSWNDQLFLQANVASTGTELYQFDGVSLQMTDIAVGAASSSPANFHAHQGALYFQANDGVLGAELYSSDGNSVSLVEDIRSGSRSSAPKEFAEFDGDLYFQANSGGAMGRELHKFDGTSVTLVADIRVGSKGSKPNDLTVFDGDLYFEANDGSTGNELHKFDGASVAQVADLNPGTSASRPTDMVVFQDQLYFQATDGATGRELYRFDGSNISLAADIRAGSQSSRPSELTVLGDRLYFHANDGTHGSELYSFDGVSAQLVEDYNLGTAGSKPRGLASMNGELYFSADNGSGDVELHKMTPDDLHVIGYSHDIDYSQVFAGHITVGNALDSELIVSGANLTAGIDLVVNPDGDLWIAQNATITAPQVAVSSTGRLGGKGQVQGDVDVAGTLSPGDSPGLLAIAGDVTMSSSGIFEFEVNDFLGTAGSDPGWDLLDVSGALAIAAGATMRLVSLSGTTAGLATNFDNALNYSLLMAQAPGGITGQFALDTSAFQNETAGGHFSLNQSGNALYLEFQSAASCPEPSSFVLFGFGLLGFAVYRWRSASSKTAIGADDQYC
ncbi:MAG: PEP-CTERM sorting domain-containing protein [Planctomycetaceae bacterium]